MLLYTGYLLEEFCKMSTTLNPYSGPWLKLLGSLWGVDSLKGNRDLFECREMYSASR